MTELQLRRATREDLPFARQCAVQAYSLYVDRIGREPAPMVQDFAAALKDDELEIVTASGMKLGFLVSRLRGDHLFIENIALHPDHQGKGLARQTFALLEQRAQQAGRVALELYTNEKMTENLGLYPRLGFVETERRSEAGFNRVYFRKELP